MSFIPNTCTLFVNESAGGVFLNKKLFFEEIYENLKKFAKNISQDLFHSLNSAGCYSTIRQTKTIDAMDEGFSDEIIRKVTKAINGGDHGLAERVKFTNWTKEYLKFDSICINK